MRVRVRVRVRVLLLLLILHTIGESSCRPSRQTGSPLLKTKQTASKHDVYCYQKLCTCNGTVATCSDTRLTIIPTLWENITELIFTGNQLPRVTASTFDNITSLHLVRLALTWNNISTISTDAFSVLLHLHTLELTGNCMSPVALAVGLRGLRRSPVRTLILKYMKLPRLPPDIFHEMNTSRIEVINLGFNYIKDFDQEIFSSLPFLHELMMYKNSISTLKWGYSKSIKVLVFTGNSDLETIPSFCNGLESFYPELEQLLLDELRLMILTSDNFTCLPNLNYITISNNPMKAIDKNTFSVLPRLQTVLAHNMKDNVLISREAFNNPTLESIHISANSKRVDNGVFDGCHGLKSMDMSGNHYSYVKDAMLTRFFRDLHGLTSLNIEHSSLQYFPSIIYTKLRSLETLILSANDLRMLPNNLFQNLTNLTRFDVALNQISGDKEEPFPDSVKHQLKDVSLGGNPFACTCDTRWLMEWLRREPQKFRGYPLSYKCNSPPDYAGEELVKLFISEQPCLLQRRTYIIFVAAFTSVLLLLIVCSVVYRFRWHIRYIIFLLKYQGHHKRPAGNRLTFDAFVVYSPDDIKWIKQHLIPRLEEEKGLKLCIHERDFDVGGAIVDNIVENVECSRKVLIVLSRNCLECDWCQFEINFAYRRSLRARPGSLVIVLKDPIDSRFVTNSICVLLNMHSYVTWPENADDADARMLFWDRIASEINREPE